MEKIAALCWGADEVSGDDLRDALVDSIPGVVDRSGGADTKICVTDGAVAAGSALHVGSLRPHALVTWWTPRDGWRSGVTPPVAAVVDVLSGCTARVAAYRVVESTPLRLPDPPRGARCDGFVTVSCIRPPVGGSPEAFLAHWMGPHRDVAIETQDTTSYVRNEVIAQLSEGAPPWLGIVEETFPIEALTDPYAFYDAVGDEDRFQANFGRLMGSVNAFLDISEVESHPMSEYRFPSA